MTEEEFRRELAAAEAGSAPTQAWLGAQLLFGAGVPTDYALAHRLLEMAHAQGVLAAASALGLAYLEGLGVEPDLVRATRLLEDTARRGNWYALIELARFHATGSVSEARRYYQWAIDTVDGSGWEDSDELAEAELFVTAGQ